MSTTIQPPVSPPLSGPDQPASRPDAAGSPDLITILDPRDGALVGRLEPTGRAEIRAAVAAARGALPGWAGTDPAERGRLLRKAAAALALRAAEVAAENTRETGRPGAEALAGVRAGVATLEQYAELGPVHRGHSLRGAALAADYTVAVPRGVAVVLTPWNDPVAVSAGLIGAALATGNTVVAKPSERAPHTGKLLGEILAPVFPAGVLATVTGGADVGAQLSMETGVDVLAHVGSSATGARIARAAALTGAHVILENGGNDPLLVDADVDPRWAAGQAAVGAFSNSGQICTSVERIYVHRNIADAFCAELIAEARQRNRDRAMAPLVDTRLRETVHRHVVQALLRGATVAEGGALPEGPGAHYPATVLLNCSAGMEVFDTETFGPVAPVQVVDSFEEGLALAAAGSYGLAATVLTGSIAHAQQSVAALDVGTVKINAVFGGGPGGSAQPRRRSGRGFGYGPELLDEFSLVKVVHVAPPGPAAPGIPA
ncbi:aldehyde dehydrogenase family protein [Arthrobacter sp. zg-Y769]|uniref:aldehyde dehydrogenase family protein n=1 Tax=Arthrobacter sp. zg-Y769 TaxID=2894191 RepID=UPI001E5794A1|nr:aldehyde dehydrogenase family protein [Arthrobacter sp. zg-Y769]MCC9205763.1 aldehyde dehydrogenase family protein [Arthrobacter sp. zg-Y769]